jgi:hypothetical protein
MCEKAIQKKLLFVHFNDGLQFQVRRLKMIAKRDSLGFLVMAMP